MRKGYLYLAGLLLLVLLCAFVACDSFSGGGGISDKPDCDHDIVKVSGKEATCTENGWNSYEKCDKCGYTTYSEVPALGHDTVWHEGKFSTCTEIGWTEYVTCNRCDYSTYEEAPARGHSEIVHDAKAPTCTEIGWDEYVSCNYCDYTTYVEKAATGHDLVSHEAQAASCTKNGWDAYVTCNNCDYSTYSEIWADGHSWGAQPTCTADQVCTVCGEVGYSAYGHNPGWEATCTSAQYCTRCNEVIQEALGHDEIEHSGKAASCTENGWEPYVTCSRCDYSTYEEISSQGHVDGANATCTTDKTCTVCGDVLERAFGHVTGNYADCENDSLCAICGDKLADALGHNEIEYDAKAPTCTEIGWNAYVSCSRCSYSTYIAIPADGHDCVDVGDVCSKCGFMKASEGLAFRSNYDGTYVVSGIGECRDSTVVIPLTTPDGDPVSGIKADAFTGCEQIVTVILQDNIQSIGANAFENCTGIESVNVPNSVKQIGEKAFFNCSALTSIDVGEDNENYCSIDGILYNKDVSILIAYCIGKDTASIEIPDTVTKISDYAFFGSAYLESVSLESVAEIGISSFENCVKLDNVTLPEQLSTLSDRAFAGCTSLSAIAIPELITVVPTYAFNGCTALENVTLHENLEKILPNAFENCVSIAEISFPEMIKIIGANAFKGCIGLATVTVPDSVEGMGVSAFGGCTSLESVTLPFVGTNIYGYGGFGAIFDGNTALKTVTVTGACYIPQGAFKGCSGLTNIVLSENIVQIESDIFSGCSSLESITIPYIDVYAAGLESTLFGKLFGKSSYTDSTAVTQYYSDNDYYYSVFYLPNSLKNVTVLGGILGHGVFSGCSTIENIDLVNITGISGARHFEGCTAIDLNVDSTGASYIGNSENQYLILISVSSKDITSFTVPDSTKMIADGVFRDCVNLSNVILPDTLVSIGGNAFSGCIALNDINIPSSLTSIGEYAFYGCEALTSVVIPEGVTEIKVSTFYGCKNLQSVIIEGTVTNIGDYAFSFCEKLRGIEIPEGCAVIGEVAFQSCTSLEYVKLPSTIKEIKANAFNNCVISDAVYIPSIEDWLEINFVGGYSSSPLKGSGVLKVNGEILTELTIPEGVTEIREGAFVNCKTLTYVTIPSSVKIIGAYAFSGCTSLESITVPDSVTAISKYAFEGCTSLKNATLPKWLNAISAGTFKDCTSLTKVNIPSSVSQIGEYAFKNCSSLMSITLPASLRNTTYTNAIGTGAFSGCYRLVEVYNLSSLNIARDDNHPEFWGGVAAHSRVIHTSATTPSRIRVDGDWVFFTMDDNIHSTIGYTNQLLIAYIGSDTDVTLPSNGSYYVNGYAFYATNVEKITFSNDLIGMFDYAFAYAEKLVSVDTKESEPHIGNYAFYQCSSLEEITIGSNITSIGNYAFDGCNKLTNAYFAVTDGWEYRKPLFNSIMITGLSSPSSAASSLKAIGDRSMSRTE